MIFAGPDKGGGHFKALKNWEHRSYKKTSSFPRRRESIVLIVSYVPAGQWIPTCVGMTNVCKCVRGDNRRLFFKYGKDFPMRTATELVDGC